MSTLKTNNVQVGQSVTATNNFTLYQPSSPDGTVRLGVGNSEATSADAVIVDNAGLFKFNSGFGSAATAYGCRAWVNFNGTGTVAIRGSGNVTSITDGGTGEYTVNLTTAMPDANYAAVITCADGGNGIVAASRTLATTTCGVGITNATVGRVDSATVSVSIFR
jgi:hypothetical protein